MNSPLSSKQTFTKESLKKQFRLSEFLAEKIISSVAFLSIAIILLIFVFVFKESLPIFNFGAEEKKAITTEVSTATAENYDSTSSEELQPESYGDVKAEPLTADSGEMTDKVTENTDGAGNTWNTFLKNFLLVWLLKNTLVERLKINWLWY